MLAILTQLKVIKVLSAFERGFTSHVCTRGNATEFEHAKPVSFLQRNHSGGTDLLHLRSETPGHPISASLCAQESCMQGSWPMKSAKVEVAGRLPRGRGRSVKALESVLLQLWLLLLLSYLLDHLFSLCLVCLFCF